MRAWVCVGVLSGAKMGGLGAILPCIGAILAIFGAAAVHAAWQRSFADQAHTTAHTVMVLAAMDLGTLSLP